MRTIVLLMQCKPVAQRLMQNLRNTKNLRMIHEPNYANASALARVHYACVALIEIAESGEYNAAFCTALCHKLHRESPRCRLLLMCPEQNEACIAQAVDGKQKGYVDDFVFCDCTIEYLTAKLLSLV